MDSNPPSKFSPSYFDNFTSILVSIYLTMELVSILLLLAPEAIDFALFVITSALLVNQFESIAIINFVFININIFNSN